MHGCSSICFLKGLLTKERLKGGGESVHVPGSGDVFNHHVDESCVMLGIDLIHLVT